MLRSGSPTLQISAKRGTGVDDLLETVTLVAEVEQLMSNPTKSAAGTVLEAHLDRRIGAISTLLVQTGTLKVGDVVVAGAAYGKVCACTHAHLLKLCTWASRQMLLHRSISQLCA